MTETLFLVFDQVIPCLRLLHCLLEDSIVKVILILPAGVIFFCEGISLCHYPTFLSSSVIFSLSICENLEGSQSIGSINSARGVSVKFSNHRTQTLYSLSVGIKCDLSSNSIQLIFWGYAWQDWKVFRFFEGPITYAYIWRDPNSPISENELKERFLDDLCKRNTEFDKIVPAIGEI